ncbi:MAG: endonuclease III [Saprospiraceae bacterium]|nr:endonuclease III [Saprospiraceae bacterium]
MTKQERAGQIAGILENLFPNPPIPLHHEDAYTLLIAVLLSAQCTDERVNKITPELFRAAKDPQAVVDLGEARIREIIRPCGLAPAKSKNIYKLSQILIDDYQGIVPDDMDKLEALPGVGHKTASVVMAQAFDEPAFPVDTHIHRLAYRWKLSNGKNVRQTEKDLKALFPIEKWNDLHLQIIYFGRKYCPARGHDPNKCPICSKFGRKSMFAKGKPPLKRKV